jgi:hypothetical protein
MPDDLGGGFVTGELLLRADGVLLRRQTLFSRRGRQPLRGVRPLGRGHVVGGQTDPERAAIVLHHRGYDLHQRDPAGLGTPQWERSRRIPHRRVTVKTGGNSFVLALSRLGARGTRTRPVRPRPSAR